MKMNKNKLAMLFVILFSFTSIAYATLPGHCTRICHVFCTKCSNYIKTNTHTLNNHCFEMVEIGGITVKRYLFDTHYAIGTGDCGCEDNG